MEKWEKLFKSKIQKIATTDDPSHDILHFERVVKIAKHLCDKENGKFEVVVPATWLHDFVIVPKNDPRRSQASRLSAIEAEKFLSSINYPSVFISEIAHAIEGHSFSANVETRTLEAKIVQDADRLDALGAIGIARCFATAGLMKRAFYDYEDPFCKTRQPDDSAFTIDHFYKKLFLVAQSLQTEAGKIEGLHRLEVMKYFLAELSLELE
jgi:uncharacterized protein